MPRFISILTIALVLLGVQKAQAVNGVEFALTVHQHDSTTDSQVLLYTDTATVLVGQPAVGFPLAFSVELLAEAADSLGTVFTIHAITLDQPPHNYAQRFRVEYGLPSRLEPIVGKHGAAYRLTVVPLRQVDVDTSACGYIHTKERDFNFDPSAHLDIYFAPQTLGDFHWNAIKGMMEDYYERFDNLNKFTLPGKYALYLCPCPLYSVLWDRRFMMVVDPTRSSTFAVYDIDFNSADPFLVASAATLRNYGYAPPVLSEGFANYLTLSIYDMQKMLRSGAKVSLDDFLDTYTYLTQDPVTADRVAGSFVKYLINTYQFDRFMQAYRQADDLNLRTVLENTYGQSIAELEQGWRTYLDTVTIPSARFQWAADIAETMRQFTRSRDLYREALRRATSRGDSMRYTSRLARAEFFTGNYYAAAENEAKLIAMDSSIANWYMTLAGYEMMNGEYDTARRHLEIAHTKDTTSDIIRFNLALNYLFAGEREEGLRRLRALVLKPGDGGAQVESRLMLANALVAGGAAAEKKEASDLYAEALALLDRQGPPPSPSATRQLWLGIAYLGTGDTGSAGAHLNTAMYLEIRPFYRGMINLWLGKLADILGQRSAAREYYGLVISGASAAYHQAEARTLLDHPYHQ